MSSPEQAGRMVESSCTETYHISLQRSIPVTTTRQEVTTVAIFNVEIVLPVENAE